MRRYKPLRRKPRKKVLPSEVQTMDAKAYRAKLKPPRLEDRNAELEIQSLPPGHTKGATPKRSKDTYTGDVVVGIQGVNKSNTIPFTKDTTK